MFRERALKIVLVVVGLTHWTKKTMQSPRLASSAQRCWRRS